MGGRHKSSDPEAWKVTLQYFSVIVFLRKKKKCFTVFLGNVQRFFFFLNYVLVTEIRAVAQSCESPLGLCAKRGKGMAGNPSLSLFTPVISRLAKPAGGLCVAGCRLDVTPIRSSLQEVK